MSKQRLISSIQRPLHLALLGTMLRMGWSFFFMPTNDQGSAEALSYINYHRRRHFQIFSFVFQIWHHTVRIVSCQSVGYSSFLDRDDDSRRAINASLHASISSSVFVYDKDALTKSGTFNFDESSGVDVAGTTLSSKPSVSIFSFIVFESTFVE
jgi:hypothetical protein